MTVLGLSLLSFSIQVLVPVLLLIPVPPIFFRVLLMVFFSVLLPVLFQTLSSSASPSALSFRFRNPVASRMSENLPA